MSGINPILTEFRPRKADFGLKTIVHSGNILNIGHLVQSVLTPADEGDYNIEYNANFGSSELKIYINSHLLRDRLVEAIKVYE